MRREERHVAGVSWTARGSCPFMADVRLGSPIFLGKVNRGCHTPWSCWLSPGENSNVLTDLSLTWESSGGWAITFLCEKRAYCFSCSSYYGTSLNLLELLLSWLEEWQAAHGRDGAACRVESGIFASCDYEDSGPRSRNWEEHELWLGSCTWSDHGNSRYWA